MLSFLKRKVSGTEIGAEFFKRLRDGHAAGFAEDREFFPVEAQISRDAVIDEWLYFEVFLVDYSTYLALGRTSEKSKVLDLFWLSIQEWLGAHQVVALPERLAVLGGGPRSIPPEKVEYALARLLRRMKTYCSAIQTPHRLGENYSVASVFLNSCGNFNAITVTGISTLFSSRKIGYVELLKSVRIV
ncbi:MAG TPA: hypothetical protein VFV96_08670 [Verrucomicrobiae bacterium]|nr:hypothetical protein [Verrucomicrobiae bacterium]